MLVGFSGMPLTVYSEAKRKSNAEELATSKKLAGMSIEMILKIDPDNLRIENSQIVMSGFGVRCQPVAIKLSPITHARPIAGRTARLMDSRRWL
jgi:hypothetical protein